MPSRSDAVSARPRLDPALAWSEPDLMLLAALCHLRRGDPRTLVDALLAAAAEGYRREAVDRLLH